MAIYENPSSPARRSFLVYFNGVAVPAISVSVTSKVWEFPVASITVPADKTLRRLGREDKIQVAIFYLDTDYFVDTPTFCLLFEGELRAWSYRSHASGRVMQFDAQGHGAIMTQLFPFFMTGLDDMVSATTSNASTGVAVSEWEGTMTASLLYRGLNVKGATPIKRPFGYIQNILMALYGVSNNYVNGSVTQYFFGKWARMTNFHNKWVPAPYLEYEDLTERDNKLINSDGVFPLMRAVQSKVTIDTIAHVQMRIGTNGSFWDLIRQIFSLYEYEVAINPAPAYAQVDLDTGKILGPPAYGVSTEGRGKPPFSPDLPNRLIEFVTKPAAAFTVPPMCNVIYPSMLKSYGFQENYATEPTRIYVSDKTLYQLFARQKGGALSKYMVEAQTVAYPPVVNKFMARKRDNPNISGYNMLNWPEEFFKGPVILTHTTPQWYYTLANAYRSAYGKSNPIVDSLVSQVYSTYAATEYYRERYSNKYGAVETVFNPYAVAGYPGVIFDNLDMGMHTNMSVLSVTHNLTQSSFSTSISYTFAQSFDDFFELRAKDLAGAPDSPTHDTQRQVNAMNDIISKFKAKTDFSGGTTAEQNAKDIQGLQDVVDILEIGTPNSVDVAPIHPVPDIRYRLQNHTRAEQFYASLFHRNVIDPKERMGERQAAFSVAKRVKIKINDSFVSPADSKDFLSKFDEQATFDYELSEEDKEYAASTELAMNAIARPVCTLDEYINSMDDRGLQRQADYIAANDERQGLGGHYYVQIAEYVPGPGPEPPRDNRGFYTEPPKVDTRMDWTKLLLEYREKVLNSDAPFKV